MLAPFILYSLALTTGMEVFKIGFLKPRHIRAKWTQDEYIRYVTLNGILFAMIVSIIAHASEPVLPQVFGSQTPMVLSIAVFGCLIFWLNYFWHNLLDAVDACVLRVRRWAGYA